MASRGTAFEFGTVLAIVLTILALSLATQERITVNDGRGYDGSHYYQLAEQFTHGERPSGESRFVRRVGTPLLASLIAADDLVVAFFVVNAIAAVLSILLLNVWLRRYISSPWLRLGLVLVHATHWLQLVRFTTFYPVLVDAWAQVACFAGLIAIASYAEQPHRWKIAVIALVSALGVWVREVVLLVPLALLFVSPSNGGNRGRWSNGWLARLPRPGQWVPLIAAVASMAALESFVVATDEAFSGSDHLIGRALSRDALTYALGWMVAFGPALAVIVADWPRAADFLRRHAWMLAYLLLTAGVGWAGSFESERHALNWATPIVLLLAGRTLERRATLARAPSLAGLALVQLLVNRVFWSIPQPAAEPVNATPTILLTAIGPNASYLDLFPAYMPRELAWMQLLQHLAVAAVVIWLVHPAPASASARLLRTMASCSARWALAMTAALATSVRAVPRMSARHLMLAFGVPFIIGSSAGLALGVVALPEQPVPIHVRWTLDTQPSMRAVLERQWRLSDARWREGSTWAYLLRDASTDLLRSIVEHPGVEDTAHVNRRWFRPEFKYDRPRQVVLLGLLFGSMSAAAWLLRAASARTRHLAPSASAAFHPPPEPHRGRSSSEALGNDFRADVAGRRPRSAEQHRGTVADE